MKVTWLDPQPLPSERPDTFVNPFDEYEPHPLAQRCARLLMAELAAGFIAPGVPTSLLRRDVTPDSPGGKMFGVLAFDDGGGRVGFISAFSGQLGRAWSAEGYAPPVFDAEHRARVEPPASEVVGSLTRRVDEARADPTLLRLRAELRAMEERHQQTRDELKRRNAQRKEERRLVRESSTDDARRALDHQSRLDDAERRVFEAKAREELAALKARLRPVERRLAALERLRRLVSREAMRRIWDSYVLTSFAGERKPLLELFPGVEPPGGAADCAAPRLLDAARRNGWKPLAIAEFWWGDAPPGGSRVQGTWYPACREKCGPVLPFMMEGLAVTPRRVFRPPSIADDFTVVHHDARFLVIDKPAGLLSVPAREASIDDSVVARVRIRFPAATGPLTVHRLDLDTSGLLLIALDLECHRLLQEQFLSRQLTKSYVAVLDGDVKGHGGRIELPLRVDLEQRPRQLVDFEHGRPAITDWHVLSRDAGRTRVSFRPQTGRTHQLRVHALQGLGVPIVGDRLYGRAREGERLLLHASELHLRHPFTGASLVLRSEPPF